MSKQKFNELHLVIGFVKDKSVEDLLHFFPKKAYYYFVKPNVPRGLDEKALKQMAKTLGLKGKRYDTVQDGLAKAKSKANPQDLIYVGGSTFVVAEVV